MGLNSVLCLINWSDTEISDDSAEKDSLDALADLENIDDECDQKGISFVRIDSSSEEKEYGLEDTPALLYFENKIPSLYTGQSLASFEWMKQQLFQKMTARRWRLCAFHDLNIPRFCFRWIGDLKNEEDVLAWLTHQLESEEIEDVTDEMLDVLIGKMPNLAVLFCELTSSHFTIIAHSLTCWGDLVIWIELIKYSN